MIVSLTGTPGTGKTSVAEELEGFQVVEIGEFARERGLGEQGEEFEVDLDAAVEALRDELEPGKDTVVEGHLSHHFPSDCCVVLRCRPDELRERLEKRGYPGEKVEENVEAEALDIVLQEALELQEKVIEVDTTGREAGEVAAEVSERLESGDTGYGEVDWSSFL